MSSVSAYIKSAAQVPLKEVTLPPETEIQAAAQTLAHCPVVHRDGFTRKEVEIIGAYRELMAPRARTTRVDYFWSAIVSDQWNAWPIAIHEASEFDALWAQGINPFDWKQQDVAALEKSVAFWEAHCIATTTELSFLWDWANALGFYTSESALLRENPVLKPYRSHQRFVEQMQERQHWEMPTVSEQESARRFWDSIRGLL